MKDLTKEKQNEGHQSWNCVGGDYWFLEESHREANSKFRRAQMIWNIIYNHKPYTFLPRKLIKFCLYWFVIHWFLSIQFQNHSFPICHALLLSNCLFFSRPQSKWQRRRGTCAGPSKWQNGLSTAFFLCDNQRSIFRVSSISNTHCQVRRRRFLAQREKKERNEDAKSKAAVRKKERLFWSSTEWNEERKREAEIDDKKMTDE